MQPQSSTRAVVFTAVLAVLILQITVHSLLSEPTEQSLIMIRVDVHHYAACRQDVARTPVVAVDPPHSYLQLSHLSLMFILPAGFAITLKIARNPALQACLCRLDGEKYDNGQVQNPKLKTKIKRGLATNVVFLDFRLHC